MRRIRSLVAILAFGLFGTAACTGVGPLAPEGVDLVLTAENSKLTAIGARTKLQLRFPDGVVPVAGSVSWRSNAPLVAAVDGEGMVTAMGDGVATITAEVQGMSASTTITVEAMIQSVATVRSDLADGNSENDSVSLFVVVQAD